MGRPRLLDLYCGAGGAAKGYTDAGFEVWGVDLNPQPRYPYAFIRVDALTLDQRFLAMFDAIHASPPCQFGTIMRHAPNAKGAAGHLNLIPATRALLRRSGKPYVIENVEAVREHLLHPVMFCGTTLACEAHGYQLQRHRLFETNWPLCPPMGCNAADHDAFPIAGIYGGHVRIRSAKHGGRRTRDLEGVDKPALARALMRMPWATMNEMSEAIPPLYTEVIGEQLLEHLERRAAA